MTKADDRALQMLSTAMEMEKKGEAFYEKAMNECKTEPGKEIFSMLMADELVHMGRIQKIYDYLNAGQDWSDEWESTKIDARGLGKLFKKMTDKHGQNIKADSTDLDALDVGIDLELKALKYYEGHLTRAADPLERNFLKQMIVEERGHYNALSDMKFYLIDPVSWFQDKERPGLDGST